MTRIIPFPNPRNHFPSFNYTSLHNSQKKKTESVKMCKTKQINWTICGHTDIKTDHCRPHRKPNSLLNVFHSPCEPRKTTGYQYGICPRCRSYWKATGVSDQTAIEQYQRQRARDPEHEGPLSPHAYRSDRIPCLLRDGQMETGRRVSHSSELAYPAGSEVAPIMMREPRGVQSRSVQMQRTKSAPVKRGREQVGRVAEAQESNVTLWPSSALQEEEETRRETYQPPIPPRPVPSGYGGDLMRSASGTQARQHAPPQPSSRRLPPTQESQDDYIAPRVHANPYRDSRFPPPPPLAPATTHRPVFRDAQGRVKTPPKNLDELFNDLRTDRPPPPLKRTRQLDFRRNRPAPLRVDDEKPLPPPPRQDSPMPGASFSSKNPDRDLPRDMYYRRVI